jgi:hypothetical protein
MLISPRSPQNFTIIMIFRHTQQWRREGFWRPGQMLYFSPPQAHDILWGCIERPFFTSPFAYSALNLNVWCCHRFTGTPPGYASVAPLTGNNNKHFLPPTFGAPSLWRPGAIAPPDPPRAATDSRRNDEHIPNIPAYPKIPPQK